MMLDGSDSKVTIEDFQYLLMLLDPSFIEIDGLVLLAAHYDADNFDEYWKGLRKEDAQKTERTINHVHLSDLVESAKAQQNLGNVILKIWSERLKSQFPNKNFKLELIQHQNEWLIELSSA